MSESIEIQRLRRSTARLEQRRKQSDAGTKQKAVSTLEEPTEACTEQGMRDVVSSMSNGHRSDASYKLTILEHMRNHHNRQRGEAE